MIIANISIRILIWVDFISQQKNGALKNAKNDLKMFLLSILKYF